MAFVAEYSWSESAAEIQVVVKLLVGSWLLGHREAWEHLELLHAKLPTVDLLVFFVRSTIWHEVVAEAGVVTVQASGEAVYVADVGISTRELFAAPVESTQALAKLGKVDPSAALKLPGVVAFVGKPFSVSSHL